MKQEEEWRNETRGKQVKILSAKPGMKQLVHDDWNCKWQIFYDETWRNETK